MARFEPTFNFSPVPVSTAGGWDSLPAEWNGKKIRSYVALDKRGRFPKRIEGKVSEDGWMVMAQAAEPFSPVQINNYKKEFEDLNASSYLQPQTLTEAGWEPLFRVTFKRAPYIVYRKSVKKGEQITFGIQADTGPFFMQSRDEEFGAIINNAKPAQVADLQQGGAANAVAGGANALPGAPAGTVVPNAGSPGMSIPGTGVKLPGGGLIGVVSNIFTGTPTPKNNAAMSGGNPANPFGAAPKVDKKSAFIASVVLNDLKCPVNRTAVKRDVNTEYEGGVVFFSDEAAMEKFNKNPKTNSAEANYQLFLSGQANQVSCPVTGKEVDRTAVIKVKTKEVAFSSRVTMSRVERAKGLTKFKKIFGDRPFKKAFIIEIPEAEAAVAGAAIGQGELRVNNPALLRGASEPGANDRGNRALDIRNLNNLNRDNQATKRRGGRRDRD